MATNIVAIQTEPKDHNLVPEQARQASGAAVRYEKRPAKGSDGRPVEGLYNAWITLDNPSQFNSYTTAMVKATILGFRAASVARDVISVVFTGSGDKAFCTGGNTKEYAEYYAGNPQEYRAYMRLFNDMVSAILGCDKPVICRVNGMRIGGGQEIGMACDFSVAQDLARFGQAGPKHGSAPIGGATDFLPLAIGVERAMGACVLCEPFSAHEALATGMDFTFLFDPGRKLFSIGYRLSDGCLDSGFYDLLASEARLASYLAIARGEVPVSHWFHLGRPLTPVGKGSALVSWSGSMFEYLMPSLVMRAPAGRLKSFLPASPRKARKFSSVVQRSFRGAAPAGAHSMMPLPSASWKRPSQAWPVVSPAGWNQMVGFGRLAAFTTTGGRATLIRSSR